MSLLPPWRRRQIERNTKYFHALLEADADGDLVIEDDDWRGGLNALRHDMEEISDHHAPKSIGRTEDGPGEGA